MIMTHTRYVWTSDPRQHGVELSEGEKAEAGGANSGYTHQWLYAPWLVMHEFGHTAGLTDLYKYEGYSGYLMNDYSTYRAKALAGLDVDYILPGDTAYLQQLYR